MIYSRKRKHDVKVYFSMLFDQYITIVNDRLKSKSD